MYEKVIKKFAWSVLFFFLFSNVGLATTAQYTYDNLNRLVQVQFDDGTTIQYAYDAAGNRLVQQVTAFSQMSLPGGESSSPTGQALEIPADAPYLQNFRAPAEQYPGEPGQSARLTPTPMPGPAPWCSP